MIDWTKPVRFRNTFSGPIEVLWFNRSYAALKAPGIAILCNNQGDVLTHDSHVYKNCVEEILRPRKQFILTETGEFRATKPPGEWILCEDGVPTFHTINFHSTTKHSILKLEEKEVQE